MQTRRNVLKGGGKAVAAITALSTLPFITSSAQAQEDAGLFALYEECCRLEKEYQAAEAAANDVTRAVRRQFPAVAPNITLNAQIMMGYGAEYVECLNHPSGFANRRKKLVRTARKQWKADFAEAKKRAGVPALVREKRAVCCAWLDAVHRFVTTPANTLPGAILKLKVAGRERQERGRRLARSHHNIQLPRDVSAAVLSDLERLAGRAPAVRPGGNFPQGQLPR